MRIYKDSQLAEEIEILDFGILEAGKIERYTFWVLNDSRAYLSKLEFIVDHKEVEVIEAPTELPPQATNELIFQWSPNITLREGLKCPLRIRGVELWG